MKASTVSGHLQRSGPFMTYLYQIDLPTQIGTRIPAVLRLQTIASIAGTMPFGSPQIRLNQHRFFALLAAIRPASK